MIAYAQNAADVVFGQQAVGQAGEELAGPLTSAINAGLAAAQQSANSLEEAARTPVQLEATAAAGEIADAVSEAVNKSAVEGIDSRSAEGLKTMFRIMRGDTGNDVQKEQLEVQKDIRRELQNQNNQPDIEFDVLELAPAAGA